MMDCFIFTCIQNRLISSIIQLKRRDRLTFAIDKKKPASFKCPHPTDKPVPDRRKRYNL